MKRTTHYDAAGRAYEHEITSCHADVIKREGPLWSVHVTTRFNSCSIPTCPVCPVGKTHMRSEGEAKGRTEAVAKAIDQVQLTLGWSAEVLDMARVRVVPTCRSRTGPETTAREAREKYHVPH